ncbi:MAG TPA: site-2 protease family protein [Thermoanaerobaculia bacterium]|nr:site-2 protease family protein [Thermoanaerobaculia bacterium]
MNPDQLIEGATWFVVFIFSTTVHEAGHALAAYKLGDSTAYEGGQVSLNPLPHIQREPVGMVLVPLISFALNGWMMGWASAPYDPEWAHRYPKRAAVMAAAGPAGNLILTLIAGLLIRSGLADVIPGALMPVGILFLLNLLLFVFNLLPVPPLDGSAILPMFMSDGMARRYREFLHQPMFSLLGLLLAWKVFPYLFQPIQGLAFSLLRPG